MSDVTRRASQLIEAGFNRVWVRGEVSSFKTYRSGHWYFTLRDKRAQVRCIMWRNDNQRLPAAPEEGMEIFVEAQPRPKAVCGSSSSRRRRPRSSAMACSTRSANAHCPHTRSALPS